MPNTLRQFWNGLILLSAFALPFLYILATDYVWQVGRHIPGNVEDSAIALPSGMPIIFLVCLAWISAFALLRYRSISVFRAQMGANIFAVATFLLIHALSDAMLYETLNPLYKALSPFALHPEEGLTNLFPIRFGLATVLAFACSLLAYKYRTTPQ